MTRLPDQTLRIIDANLDRATEGLRVLEDISRFVLDSAHLAGRLKSHRHCLHGALDSQKTAMIAARDASGDVGRQAEAVKEPASTLIETVIANARRTEQSLRVLEEISRLPTLGLEGSLFEEIRFSIYEIEKELIGRLSRREILPHLSGIYAVVQKEPEVASALGNDVAAIQLEPASYPRREFYELAVSWRKKCRQKEILFLIGEYVDVAVSVDADGVVLDGGSLPVAAARKLLAIDQIIGYEARSLEDAIGARDSGADFLLCSETIRPLIEGDVGLTIVVPVRGVVNG